MSSFLSAHGFDPGPTQRPVLAGVLSGTLGTIPASLILFVFGTLEVEAKILAVSIGVTLAAGCVTMAGAGALYGRLFGRGANDLRGGWLFGMAYGFLLWTAGAVMVLPLLSGGQAPAGTAATGIFLALVAWGATMGLLFPYVHRPLHITISSGDRFSRSDLGPNAASGPPTFKENKRAS